MRLRVCFLAVLALAGCAHEQPKVESSPPPVAVEAPRPSPPAPPSSLDASADLQSFLSQPVAHFEFDRASLTSDDQERLQALAGLLRARPGARIEIAGNCDERGTEEYNLELGARRAEVAKRYLVALGVEPERIETISYGEERPLDQAHDERAWAANRRDDGRLLVLTSLAP